MYHAPTCGAPGESLWRAVDCFRRQQAAPVRYRAMKIKNSLKSLKSRHRANRLVRRKGRVYIINKVNPRYKARQG